MKPLFPEKVTTVVNPVKPITNAPAPLFKGHETANSVEKGAVKPLFNKSSAPTLDDNDEPKQTPKAVGAFKAPPASSVPAASPKSEPAVKTLFANKAVTNDSTVDPFYASHPLCVNLSNKDIGRVRNIVEQANVEDTSYVLNYADTLRNRFAGLVDDILAQSTSGRMVTVSTEIDTLFKLLKSSDASLQLILNPPPPKRGWAFLGGAAKTPTVHDLITDFQSKTQQVDGVVNGLSDSVDELVKYCDSLNDLFQDNKDNFVLLNLHIIAGKILVDKLTNEEYVDRKKQLDRNPDPFKAQELGYFKDCIGRFERKVNELEIVSTAVLQNSPQIRMMQNNAKDTAERIKRVAQYVIPTWKSRCLALVNVLQGTKVTELVDLATNDVFQKNKAVLQEITKSQQEVEKTFA